MDLRKPTRSLDLAGECLFVPETEAEKVMAEALNSILQMSTSRSRLYGMDFYGNRVKMAFSKLNELIPH